MNAPTIMPEMVPAILLDRVEEYWAALLAQSDLRCAHLIRENHEHRARLSRLSPLLLDWPEYDRWAASAREYHADHKRRRR
jgi:hypothetical protein